MRAWLLDQLNGIGNLRLAEVPDPIPGPGEVVLELDYAALNPADRYLAEKQYPASPRLPHILGRDGVGWVVAFGASGIGLKQGDRRAIRRGDVGINRAGTFAERVALPAADLCEVPEHWTDTEAAGASLVYLTACQALTMWGPLPEKAVVLVTGASGGVGVAAVQLGAAMGYEVLALSRSEEKSWRLLQLGARATFNPQDRQWRDAAKSAIAPRRVDLVIDNLGGSLLPEVIALLGDLGKVSVVGRLAGPVPNFNTATLLFRRIQIGGVAVGAYSVAESRAAWDAVLKLLQKSGARPVVDSVFEFDQLPQAFERLARGPLGKVILKAKPG
jgi:NADPH2:quinone reductase